MWKTRIVAILVLILGFGIGYIVFLPEFKNESSLPGKNILSSFPIKLGLDLKGGSHLVYRADTTVLGEGSNVDDAMASLRDVIERRVNLFGVGEPVIQVQKGGFINQNENRLVVDLPGVSDVNKAIEMIGQTPLLEFKIENPNPEPPEIKVGPDGTATIGVEAFASQYMSTELSGRYLKRAILEFDQNTREPIVSIEFNDEGSKLFEQITKEQIGKTVAIFLDGTPISTPVVREAISGGKAQISGNFTPSEAKQLVGRLNSGALPVPIELISTQTIGPSLGVKAIEAGVKAGLIGILAVILFMLFWYRLPGLIASISLLIYISLIFLLYKIIPVTLTAAGIAGFIISIGIAVDANVLIFERVKEEIKNGRTISDAIQAGFSRAWFSIRDSNTSTLITALILYWFGTSLIKGFALTLALGILVSMLSAIVLTKLFMKSMGTLKTNRFTQFLFGSGLSSAQSNVIK
jgi:preprotein translocase subunit SecD